MSDTKDTNPKDRTAIHKVDLSLVSSVGMMHEAIAMTVGDCKYGGYNWREKKVSASVYVAAAKRHLDKWYEGENYDPIDCAHHLGFAKACCGILLDAISSDTLVDDRPPRKIDLSREMDSASGLIKAIHEKYTGGPERYTEKGRESL